MKFARPSAQPPRRKAPACPACAPRVPAVAAPSISPRLLPRQRHAPRGEEVRRPARQDGVAARAGAGGLGSEGRRGPA
eukprot:2569989-Alexandrium_andersonii.AAC.1